MKLAEIATLLNGKLVGNPDAKISGLAKIESAKSGELTFIANPKYAKYLNQTKATAVLIAENQEPPPIDHIIVDDPYVAFLEILSKLYPTKDPDFGGIHPAAIIAENAKIGKGVQIGPNVYVGNSAEIGDNTIIYPNCVISEKVKIGKNCRLFACITIRESCQLGDNIIIHDGTVIGSDGFGFAPQGEKYKKIPQMGIVVIENDVEIGSNCSVDRATLGETIIKQGCKIDNLVQIAHNVVVESNTVIAAQTGISGSTKIGKHVTLAGQVGIVGHIEIGDNAIVAAKSGVPKSIPAGEIWFGYPASPIMKQKKIEASLRHLPELSKKVNSLLKQINELQEKINRMDEGNER
jgi:UDP-3-O-[3-hydroxymyristoyl] glucosamine N-acyltransferase